MLAIAGVEDHADWLVTWEEQNRLSVAQVSTK